MPGACYRPFAGVLLALGLAGLLPAQAMAETTTPDAPSPEVQAVQAQRTVPESGALTGAKGCASV